MSISERSSSRTRARDDVRQPEYVVRAKTGAGRKDWATVGFAWRRDRGEGYSIKLNTMPIGNHWNGVLKLLPPYAEDDGGDSPAS
jgi:hypothetical protein